MSQLPPSAQSVYDAFNRIGLYNEPSFRTDRLALSAALMALADQVTPLPDDPEWYEESCCESTVEGVRAAILGIAKELSHPWDT